MTAAASRRDTDAVLAHGRDAFTVMSAAVIVLIVLAVLALFGLIGAIRIVREYERVVVFRLGRLRGARGPGLVLIIPLIERTRWVNLQVDTADIPAQDLITKDNVTVRVEAAVFFRVVDPIKAVVEIRDYQHAVLRIAQTTLRATLGQHDLDDLLANQAAINELLKQIIDAGTEPWGINVVKVETKDVDLPDAMKRAMARQAEAERERRAKVIAAEGEYQAAERLSQAAGVISREHGALTLRTLQTLAEVATEHNSTLVFPIPMDVLDAVQEHIANGRPSVVAGHTDG
ncbi:MAG TPA: slipin family protein [Solirubrobacteraceae bacterium]|nr:slipin family protein [Solirubrobacteraceae bacterium]